VIQEPSSLSQLFGTSSNATGFDALSALAKLPSSPSSLPIPGLEAWSGKAGLSLGDHVFALPPAEQSPEEKVFDRLMAMKVATANVAMHLRGPWRDGFFRQLDHALDAEDWDFSDELPTIESFRTLLRTIVFLGKNGGELRRPSIAANATGHVVAAWSERGNRLTIECLPNDEVRWVLGKTIDGNRVSAAGQAPVTFLPRALEAYAPGDWWRAVG
jgi:hypothetical protein